jgi:hypothetical protein
MTVSGVIWKPMSEYTPTVMSRSWTMAMNAASAIFGSKRMLMYATTAMKKTINASSARLVI